MNTMQIPFKTTTKTITIMCTVAITPTRRLILSHMLFSVFYKQKIPFNKHLNKTKEQLRDIKIDNTNPEIVVPFHH
jgi:hypothetical protein